MKYLLLIFTISVLINSSCKKSSTDTIPINQKYSAPDKVEPYVKRFEFEGNKRGVNVDVHSSNIEISFGIATGGNAAVTYLNTSKIVIDSVIWNNITTDLEKERIVFHELGHCYLKRSHFNEVFPTGSRNTNL